MPELLYLIDVYSLVFQVFHAIPEMTSPRGLPTNAVFGFTRDILNILKEQRPTHLVCASDAPGPVDRSQLYAAYKAQRSETPAELVPQFPMIRETIEAFGIPLVEFPGWEADDVIATAVDSAQQRDMDVVIVSNDKDLRQLLGPRVKIYHVRKNLFLGPDELLADWGVRPDQVIDFQALVGDSVDNVPGVPLVGPKKASALLSQYGTLENVLANAGQVSGAKLRENLTTHAEQARISRQLVELKRDLRLDIDWHGARVGQWDVPRLERLFREYGFRRFGEEVRSLVAASGGTATPPLLAPATSSTRKDRRHARGATLDFPADDEQAADSEPSAAISTEDDAAGDLSSSRRTRLQVSIVDTPEKLAAFAAELAGHRSFCLNLEATNADPLRADIIGWAISWEPHVGWYIPVRGPDGQPRLEPQAVANVLRPILERPEVEAVNQNIKQDMLLLRRAGIRLRGLGLDPMVGSYLLEAGARSYSLDELARQYFQHEMTPRSDLVGKGLFASQLDQVDTAQIGAYAAERAEIAWDLAACIGTQLRDESLWDLYWDLERPLIEVLAEMQDNGIRVDVAQLHEQSRDLGQRLSGIREQIYALAGREFNIDSPKQLQAILFDELKLPVMRKNKTGASTDQEVLEQLAPLHPLPSKMVEHRTLSKLKNTYLDALPGVVNPATGRIHTSFSQVSAATGRLSSSEPNLQNIPIRTEEGRRIRRAFLPSTPESRLVCADYSQIELRMLSHFSGDPVLQEAFRQEVDIHTAVAADVFGVAPEAVDAEMRRMAKAVNFGVIYGQSPFGLAANLGIPQSEAATFIDNYFSRYAGVDRFLRDLLQQCLQSGYATTILGRRRAIEGIRSVAKRNRQRNLPERTAINTVIQGSAADLIKQAMINVYRRLEKEEHPAKLLLQIHDELVLDCPADRVAELAGILRDEMETALKLDVPIKVDLSAGNNWLDVEPLS